MLLLVALLGGLFAAGYAVSDLPVLSVTVAIGAWVLAAAALSWLAISRTALAVPVLAVVTVALAGVAVVDAWMDLFSRDTTGPVMTIAFLALLAPMAFLGLRRPVWASLLLLTIGVVQLLGSGLLRSAASGQLQWGRLLAGSSGVLVVPVLLAAVLLVVAGLLMHDHVRPAVGAHARPASH
ncbi:MAG: hypothetical protein DCC50_03330 [Acidobacteria bacterium]|nr:MAG: hypothetical protein DCC50_03330 [Acidobacteriota bacterium]